ncbi:MAG: hypothetical protein K6G70_11000 [Bacteroidaceae bacterium]|nr:hypothetical protein [Bacteroidaceae bacterium]
MATEKIAMGINLRKNKNSKNAATFGKYYPEVDVQKTLSLRGFIDHMTAHSCPYGRTTVEGVVQQITDHLVELLGQAVPVNFPGLGTFYPSAEVAKDAAVESIEAMAGLDVNDIIKGIHIRFLPDATTLDNITSPAFKAACQLELRNIVDTQELLIGGKRRKVQTLKPVATAVAELMAGNGGESTGGDTENQGGGTENGGSQGGGQNGGGTGTIDTGGNGGNTGGNGGSTDPDDGDEG